MYLTGIHTFEINTIVSIVAKLYWKFAL